MPRLHIRRAGRRVLLCAVLGTAALAGVVASPMAPSFAQTPAAAPASAAACTAPTVDMKVLVLATDGEEPEVEAIQQTLGNLGTPYTVYTALKAPAGLKPNLLASGCHAFYQAVIASNGGLLYAKGDQYPSALTDPEWQALHAYEAKFGVRQVSWYDSPTADDGFAGDVNGFDSTGHPVMAQFTAEGRKVWPYVTAAQGLAIDKVWVNTGKLAPGTTTKALLTDARGDALAYVVTSADGRQTLALAFDGNAALLHDQVLAYGLVNWATKGLFLGQRHIYMTPQIDDVFIPNFVWSPSTPCTPAGALGGATFRLTGEDLGQILAWQMDKQSQPLTQKFRFDLAINAVGTTGKYEPDSLTPYATYYKDQFKWISHTWDHSNLNEVDHDFAMMEIEKNNEAAAELALPGYYEDDLITPEISGLTNPAFMQAAVDAGIRYVVGDTSYDGYKNPSPNAGVYNPLQPSVLMIPRRPNELGYNSSTPLEWTLEYNCLNRADNGRDFNYDEILDSESNTLLGYMLAGDMDPWMFHQSNLRIYDGQQSLLTALLDLTLAKYSAYFSLPIQSPTMEELGNQMTERMRYDASGVIASIVPGTSITLMAAHDATVPVTGLATPDAEPYGGQAIAYVKLTAGQSLTLPLK